MIQFFSDFHCWEIQRTRQMTHQEYVMLLGKIVFEHNNQKREKRRSVWHKRVPDFSLCFSPNFLRFCWICLVVFGVNNFQKLFTNQLFQWETCVAKLRTFRHHQDYERLNFNKNTHLYIVGWTVRDGQVTTYQKIGSKWKHISTKFTKSTCLSTLPATLQCYGKKENLESV